MAKEAWLKELEARLAQECGVPTPATPQKLQKSPGLTLPVKKAQEPKSKGWNIGLVLLGCILGLVIVVGSVVLVQNSKLLASREVPVKQQRERWEAPLLSTMDDIDQLSQNTDEMKELMDKLDKRTAWIGARLSLLGTVHNHNFVEAKKTNSGADFLLPDRNWEIGKLPTNLTLSDADKEHLNRFVRGSAMQAVMALPE